jgi:hypothetical protein
LIFTPPSATAGVRFDVTAQVFVRNNGPVGPAVVDTTFTPTLPAGCTATTGVALVDNTVLPALTSAFLSRTWVVTCTQAGTAQINMTAASALDVTQLAIDPNLANNSKSASGSIVVN